MCIKDLSLILGAASQDQEEEASMQRIASGCWGVGREGGSEHPIWTVMFLAVDVPGRLPGSGSGTTKLPSGKSPGHCLAPFAQRPRREQFPNLSSKEENE